METVLVYGRVQESTTSNFARVSGTSIWGGGHPGIKQRYVALGLRCSRLCSRRRTHIFMAVYPLASLSSRFFAVSVPQKPSVTIDAWQYRVVSLNMRTPT